MVSEGRGSTWIMLGVFAGFSSILGLLVAVSLITGTIDEESCGGGAAAAPSAEALSDIPGNYLELYEQAAVEYKLGGDGWSVLAGVGKIETDHGRLDAAGVTSGENPWGAGGPMQFLQPTWDAYGVDGNGDGRKDRYDPRDAIPGAANYLKASGAPGDWRRALFAYNHANWYVNQVLAQAQAYRDAAAAEPQAVAQRSAAGDAVLVEGDSLAVGTERPLDALRSGVTTRAAGGRTSSEGLSDLRRVGDLPATLVVQLGTNDTSVRTFRANVRAIKELPGVTRILWVNVARPPLGGTTDDELNAVLSDESDSRMQIIDWKSMVEGGGAELAGDRIHATGDGYRARARIIHQALGGAGGSTSARVSTGAGEQPDESAASTGVIFPTRPGGPIIATPADHADRPLHNWMSDNAIDVAVPRNTDIVAVADGRIVRISGSPPSEGSGVIGGYGVTLQTADNTFWYGHLLRVDVEVGDRLGQGGVIGKSGYANGVDHLHLGVLNGDPMALFGEAEVGEPGECSGGGVPTGPANLGEVVQVSQPRRFAMLPEWAMAGGRTPQEIDARILPSALWMLRTYNLRVTAARETGHSSHGDGTALDLVPTGSDWKSTAERLSLDIGWIPACGASGVAPACPFKGWVRFVGYNGYPDHGDPQHDPDNAHLHISWQAAGPTTGHLSGPHEWIKTFPVPGEVED